MISNNWYNVYGGMMTNKTEGKDPMKRLLQVLALASALTLCASSAVGEAYAHPTYLPIVSSDSAAPGAAEQPFGYGAFSARYPGYISYEGDGYAATGHTEGWCDADRLFQVTRHVLAPNPEAFLTEPSIPEERWKGFCTQDF